ncbi:MAG TPA: RidA family protein [Bryobacteraceae bacterium]
MPNHTRLLLRIGPWIVLGCLFVPPGTRAEKKKFTPETLFTSSDFNHVVVSDNARSLVFVSAQSAADESGIEEGLSLQEQTKRTLQNLKTALEAAGATPDDVVRIHIYVTNYQQMEGPIIGRQVRRFFNNHMPASSFIPVGSLYPKNSRVQMDAEAELEGQ